MKNTLLALLGLMLLSTPLTTAATNIQDAVDAAWRDQELAFNTEQLFRPLFPCNLCPANGQ
jgi:hypothetical protein